MKKFKDYPEFTPDLTPKQVFQLGAFGGTYFRDIHKIKNAWKEFPESWFSGLDINKHVASKNCDKNVNIYKVKSGSSLEFWEKKGWIKQQDPYGWFQWYCRFYQGRRSPDDERQVIRWQRTAGPNSRFKKWLINMVAEGKDSKKIRQLLVQWSVDPRKIINEILF